MYSRVTNIWFPPGLRTEVRRVGRGLVPILREQRGFEGLKVLTQSGAGNGIIVSQKETMMPMWRRARAAPPTLGR